MNFAAPSPPADAWFDPAADAWVLSRYADVLAALRHPQLWTITAAGKDQMEVRDDSGKLAARNTMIEQLAQSKVAGWRRDFEPLAAAILDALPTDRVVDLLHDFARPCCLRLAILVTGADPADGARLGELSAAAFGGTGAPAGSETRARATQATTELGEYFASSTPGMGEPAFVGTSQTMTRLLSNGLLALLCHPDEYQRLQREPQLVPTAVEELLRYAGIVPTLYRRAYAPVEIGAARMAERDQVHLKIASANRDPAQFPDPDRLDLARRAVSHLSLGMGRNSCVGNLVIRMASAVLISTLSARFPAARIAGDIAWTATRSFCWPDAVPVLLQP